MKILKELYDNKKNVAIIIQINDNDVYKSNEKEWKKKSLNYFIKKFFRAPLSFDEVMNSHYVCDFTMRWVSGNQILCYFNSTNDELSSLEPLYQFRKFKLSYHKNYAIEPFITEKIDMNDVVWSK